jgi:hypothetical protein
MLPRAQMLAEISVNNDDILLEGHVGSTLSPVVSKILLLLPGTNPPMPAMK